MIDRTGSPMLVEALKGVMVEKISCGADFTTALCRQKEAQSSSPGSVHHGVKSEVYSWGNNDFGQLGTRFKFKKTCEPLRIDTFDVLEDEISMISCGGSHSLFLTSDHDVISCGNNRDGQCGFDPKECAKTNTPFKISAFDGVDITQLSAGYRHSLFLSSNG